MDFFSTQDQARLKTRNLVGLFGLAVVLVVLSVWVAVELIFFGLGSKFESMAQEGPWFDPERFFVVVAATLIVIVTGSLYKSLALKEGGAAVARMLGGTPIDPNTRDAAQRRLLNIVEEMAIASGLPVPTVYLLKDEEAINAFAAGLTTSDAVVAVTDGTMRKLSRDELQGVIAHEFSHILNGDMRLNLRLMGLLHGILVIALIGYWILRSMRFSGGGRKKGGAGAILLFALALLVVGYVGVFFGRWIKSAVSRQREFLADASAVQFTRNPAGLAGALKKIGVRKDGSTLKSPNAEQASHLFFGEGVGKTFFQMFSTHPPLEERIRRLEPDFTGSFEVTATGLEEELPGAVSQLSTGPTPLDARSRDRRPLDPARVAADVGTVGADHLRYGQRLLANVGNELTDHVHEPSSARAIVFCLLLDARPAVRTVQIEALERGSEPVVLSEREKLQPLVDQAPREMRLPLVDLALPALRRLSPAQFKEFNQTVRTLVSADGRIGLFEFTLHAVLLRHLAPHFQPARSQAIEHRSPSELAEPLAVVLSAFASYGHADPQMAIQAFARGAAELQMALGYQAEAEAELARVDRSLRILRTAAPAIKRQVVAAAAATVAYDHMVTVDEGELLRAVADTLDCPMPPFLPGERLAETPAAAEAAEPPSA